MTVSGAGTGGRNQHLAALAARRLSAERAAGALEDREIVVVSLATDGTDGPTGAAGGIVDTGSWSRAIRAGVDPEELLASFDSMALLSASKDLIVTGPTGTNVMDLHVALIAPLAPDPRA